MAIFHLSVNTIGRSAGRSATAAAAYRTGTLIADRRSGQVFDYTRKGGIEPSPVLILPPNAPDWAGDRAALWNVVEQTETRKNSTVAREYVVALPFELPAEARRDLALAFAQSVVNQYGCVADVAIHRPSSKGDQKNHHAHILCSTRKLEPQGFTSKTRELDDMKTGAVARLRAEWEFMVNAELERAGIADPVDHRSHKERGLVEQGIHPMIHQGRAATALARKGLPSDRVAINDEIRAVNAELLQLATERKDLEAKIYRMLADAETVYEAAAQQPKDAEPRPPAMIPAGREALDVAIVEAEQATAAEAQSLDEQLGTASHARSTGMLPDAEANVAASAAVTNPAVTSETEPPARIVVPEVAVPTITPDEQRLASFWVKHPDMQGWTGNETNLNLAHQKAAKELSDLRKVVIQDAWSMFRQDKENPKRNSLLAAEARKTKADTDLAEAEKRLKTYLDNRGTFARGLGAIGLDAKQNALESAVAKFTTERTQAEKQVKVYTDHYWQTLKPGYQNLKAQKEKEIAGRQAELERLITEIDWVGRQPARKEQVQREMQERKLQRQQAKELQKERTRKPIDKSLGR